MGSYSVPPAGSPVVVKVFPAPGKGKLVFVCLSELDGIIQHWSKGAGGKGVSTPCSGPELCPVAVHRQKQTFKGYCAAMFERPAADGAEWFPFVFEVTERCYATMNAVRPIIRTRWTVERGIGAYAEKEVFAQQLADFEGELPYQFDFRPVVERLYRTKNIAWGQEPPFGEQLILSPVKR